MSVREIRTSNIITQIPNTVEFLRGVINLRGVIVPIIDLRSRFGLGRTEPTPSHVVVIASIHDRLNGLLVDGVSDILMIEASEIADIPELEGRNRSPIFDGLITKDDTTSIIMNLDRLTESSQFPLAAELTAMAA